MTATAVALVVTAAVVHAAWNLLTKSAHDKLVFVWWTGVAGSVLLLPLALWLSPPPAWSPAVVGRVGLAAILRAAYFATLTTAYSRGDLSVVYPVARGISPIVVPTVAALVLHERPSLVAILGILAIALGVYTIHLPGIGLRALVRPLVALRTPAAGYAALTGLMTAAYSVVDKWNMSAGLGPGWYAYLTIPVAALLLTPAVVARSGWRSVWRAKRAAIVAVAVMMTGSYLLILHALQIAPVSYVAPAREVSILFGALFGVLVLGESHGRQRLLGAALIAGGVVALATSPH